MQLAQTRQQAPSLTRRGSLLSDSSKARFVPSALWTAGALVVFTLFALGALAVSATAPFFFPFRSCIDRKEVRIHECLCVSKYRVQNTIFYAVSTDMTTSPFTYTERLVIIRY